MTLSIKSVEDTQWDCVSFGEVMLRLDPGFGRVRNARSFQVWEGGGEYNVSRALKKCFRQRTSVVSALPKNEIGFLVEDLIMQGGVDTSHLIWHDFDGIGRNTRVGLNFSEKGFGVRAALSCSDRANSAASQIKPGDVNWDHIFGVEGVRWFQTGGIFAGLSQNTADAVIEAVKCAHKYKVIVGYDLNYRSSIWSGRGGVQEAQRINKQVVQYVDVLIGNEEDFTKCLGRPVDGLGEDALELDIDAYKKMVLQLVRDYPNLKVVATTLRKAKTATLNDWSALLYCDGHFYQSVYRENLEIFDRIGGGDSFVSGLAYALLQGKSPQDAVEYGAAHGALSMTTPGDTSMVSVDEVEAVISGTGARIIR